MKAREDELTNDQWTAADLYFYKGSETLHECSMLYMMGIMDGKNGLSGTQNARARVICDKD